MASGFGLVLSFGILLTESFGPVIGSAAIFNDLARELLAIMLRSGSPQPFNGVGPVRSDFNGLYVAGITALRRRRSYSGGYRTWLYPQPAGPPLNGVLLGLIPLWW